MSYQEKTIPPEGPVKIIHTDGDRFDRFFEAAIAGLSGNPNVPTGAFDDLAKRAFNIARSAERLAVREDRRRAQAWEAEIPNLVPEDAFED